MIRILKSAKDSTRYRLNRGGDRRANAALYRSSLSGCDMTFEPGHMKRRTAEGKTKIEVIRCLKRYVAREVCDTPFKTRGIYKSITITG